MTRDEIVKEARSWIDTPWHHRQCIKAVAVDCVRFIEALARFSGAIGDDFVMPDYEKEPDGVLLKKMCDRYLIPTQDKRIGDILLLAPDVKPQHVGVLAHYKWGGFSLIHASNAPSCRPPRVIETRLMFARNLKFVAAYAFPGVA